MPVLLLLSAKRSIQIGRDATKSWERQKCPETSHKLTGDGIITHCDRMLPWWMSTHSNMRKTVCGNVPTAFPSHVWELTNTSLIFINETENWITKEAFSISRVSRWSLADALKSLKVHKSTTCEASENGRRVKESHAFFKIASAQSGAWWKRTAEGQRWRKMAWNERKGSVINRWERALPPKWEGEMKILEEASGAASPGLSHKVIHRREAERSCWKFDQKCSGSGCL